METYSEGIWPHEASLTTQSGENTKAMTGASVLMQTLQSLGVRYIFGIVGREASAILFNETPTPRFILTRHEFTAGIMADVYARITGQPQVAFTTLGPGATNLTTALASACLDRSPVLAISAQAESYDLKYNHTHQCIDQVSVMRPLCKSACEVQDVSEIPQKVSEAFAAALTELKGPSFVSVPIDLLRKQVTAQVASSILVRKSMERGTVLPQPDNRAIVDLVQAISNCRQPIAILGNAILRDNATAETRQFLEKYGIPCVSSYTAKGVLPSDHPLNLGTVSVYMNGILNFDALGTIFSTADLVILIGYDYVEDVRPSMWSVGVEKRICRISPVPNPVEGQVDPDIDIVGNISGILARLNSFSLVGTRQGTLDVSALKKRIEDFLEEASGYNAPILPQYVVKTVNNILEDDGVFVTDVGLHRVYSVLFGNTAKPKTFFTSCGCATFGFALPAAMAARLAYPEKRIIAVAGDGGFHSNSQDLETAARYNLPFVLLILKDNCMGLIKLYQNIGMKVANASTVEFSSVDFVKLAEANNCLGYRITSAEELEPTILAAIASKRPAIIEVPIQYKYEFVNDVMPRDLDDFVNKTQ